MAVRTQGPSVVNVTARDARNLQNITAAEYGRAYNDAVAVGLSHEEARGVAYQAARGVVDTVVNTAAQKGISITTEIARPGRYEPVTKYGSVEALPAADPRTAGFVSQRMGEIGLGLPTGSFSYFGNPGNIADRPDASIATKERTRRGNFDPERLDVNLMPVSRQVYYSMPEDQIPANINLNFAPGVMSKFGIPSTLDTPSELARNNREAYSDQIAGAYSPPGDFSSQPLGMLGGYSPPSFGMNETNYGGYSPPSFGMNETDYGASDPYGGWSNPAEGTRSYGPSYDGGYTTGGMFGGDSFATGGQFGTPAGGYGFGQGYGESYAGNTPYGYDTPSESRAAPAEQTGSAFGGYAGYSPSPSAFGMNETDYGRSTPSYGMSETDYGQSYGQPSYGHNETDYGQTANPDATSEPAAARSVTMAPSMTATTVPGAYSPTGVTPATFGAVPSMVGMPSPDFGAATTADEAFGSVPSMVGTSFPSMAETTQPKARARARAAIDEPTYSIPTPRATYTPSYSDYMGGFVGPSGTIDQSTAMFGGIGNPLGSVIGPSPSYSGGFMGPSGAIDQSTAMFGGVGAPLGTAMDPSTPASSFGFGMPSFSGFGGWGEPGSVADTGTFGGMYGPGQIGNRGDWSGDVNTSGPGLGGALSDAFGSTNWAGSWNGVDQTGRNLGWGAAYGITPRDELGLSYGLAARGYGMGGGFGGFVGPGGQSISAATAMFGGIGAPLGSASYGFGGSDGGGMGGGGYGGNNGGGYGGNGHSSMGDASY